MITAFLIGLFGSVHCLGMCGPLAVTFTRRGSLVSFLSYHFGRLMIYSLIGVLFGLLSMTLYFYEIQKVGAIAAGILIVLIYGFPKLRNKVEGWYYRSRFYQSLKTKLIMFYDSRAKWLTAGMLNGFLPCGLVYLAAAGATLAGGVFPSIQYMLLFGAGTLPMFIGLAFFRSKAPTLWKRMSNFTTPIALVAGVVLITRGVMMDTPNANELLQLQIGKLMSVCGF